MAQLPISAGASVRGDGGNRRLYRLDILGNPAAECGAGKHGEQRRVCGGQACGGRQGQNRIGYKMGARVKLPDSLNDLLRSELKQVVYESALGRDDTLIATRYIIEKIPQIDIAAELGWERSTVSKHIQLILKRAESTSRRLFSNIT